MDGFVTTLYDAKYPTKLPSVFEVRTDTWMRHEDARRCRAFLKDLRDDVALGRSTDIPGRDVYVGMSCVTKNEADDIRALLPDEDKACVVFSWMYR